MEREQLLQLAAKLDPGENTEFVFRHVVTEQGEILIEGDKRGLQMFASQILRLLSRDYFDGVHQDFDIHAPSDQGSVRMTIQ